LSTSKLHYWLEIERHCLSKLEFWMACHEWLVLRGRVKEMFG
jgi:hypothetical protein